MTAKEQLNEMKKFIQITEGSWALPRSKRDFDKLARHLGSGNSNATMQENLYHILGDDSLFDRLDKLDPQGHDAPETIIQWMQDQRNDEYSNFPNIWNIYKSFERKNSSTKVGASQSTEVSDLTLDEVGDVKADDYGAVPVYEDAGHRILDMIDIGDLTHLANDIKNDGEIDPNAHYYPALYNHYENEIPYGWRTGDDGTSEEWIRDAIIIDYEADLDRAYRDKSSLYGEDDYGAVPVYEEPGRGFRRGEHVRVISPAEIYYGMAGVILRVGNGAQTVQFVDDQVVSFNDDEIESIESSTYEGINESDDECTRCNGLGHHPSKGGQKCPECRGSGKCPKINEGGILKNINRGVSGWNMGFGDDNPKGIRDRVRKMRDSELDLLYNDPDQSGRGSPQEFQMKVIRQEMKRRGIENKDDGFDDWIEQNPFESINLISIVKSVLEAYPGEPNSIVDDVDEVDYEAEQDYEQERIDKAYDDDEIGYRFD